MLILISFSNKSNADVSGNSGPYGPKVLVIYKSGTDQYLDTYQNFKQSYLLNIQVSAINDHDVTGINLLGFDAIYPDTSLLTSPFLSNIKGRLISYVASGGCLFLENEWHEELPGDFTGVKSYSPHKGKCDFSYPQVSYNLKQLQLVLKNFLDDFKEYRMEDLNSFKFNLAKTKGAQSLVDINHNSLLAVNNYQKGWVFMCSSLLPSKQQITGFDLKARQNGQVFFDFTLATANYYIRNEFLAFSMKEKYGFVLKKTFGPYGRPAMAWQNHYEALGSIKDLEMIKWIDLLKTYQEIPSLTLVRSSYEWGQWQTDLTVHLNKGSNKKPIFKGEEDDSYYSSGQRIDGASDHITFGDYPEFKTLMEPITLPCRAYPTVVDYNGDTLKDLIVGAPDGKLYLLENEGTSQKPSFTDKTVLILDNDRPAAVSRYAAPFVYDINKDGLFDMIVGDGDGFISVFINKGNSEKPSFSESNKLCDIKGKPIKVNGCSAPAIGAINNDGIDDLVVGDASGSVAFYKGSANGFAYQSQIIIPKQNADRFSSPAIYDWNGDRQQDILLGDNSGKIKIFINNGKTFAYSSDIEGETYNPDGTHSLIGGHNSVPLLTDWNADGIDDLIVGQLELGIPYNIDSSLFKYQKELTDILEYAQENNIPVNPHFLSHRYKNTQQETTELELHKKAFQAYNLPWTNPGINQHTWKINELNPQQTFNNEKAYGIWWNFGFNPPKNPGFPRDSHEFLWVTPFQLCSAENATYPLLFAPSPSILLYPHVYKSYYSLDMPITYFEHIEYRFSKPEALKELKQQADFLDKARNTGDYNFMTEEQMAKSFINTLFSKAEVLVEDKQIKINPDFSSVPHLAAEYKGTLGLKLEKGERLKDTRVTTTSPVHYEKDNGLYLGASSEVRVLFDYNYNSKFHIERVNVPINLYYSSGVTRLEFLSAGMQQAKIFSADSLQITGPDITVSQEGEHYTITHYGPPVNIDIY